ncbi:acetyl-CoA C-acyltransferase [Flavilitoribacter nigricans]|uniref:acetyl-CoA C-acetyltransferase n=1 Tax=Flavilitoribacter nigricans (strain ATCC 23147 / DSM 23189 / NBRC 102662 / NCIMB 1420 / SS-2) TaxID=1122177 RepID=A0A2D0N6C3_FLAN2|nr:acetyl-CoA C-acyltransferase [Flavilitoribacter nigricans]PHN04061.1 acetyl-CoA C-acyltransferase [Flavilitoribacter nigricans DSM 23189 = NBRC 102662]
MKEVFIVAAVRTPLGSFGGSLSTLSATQLGSAAIKGALEKAGLPATEIQEVFMGNVCSANLGQAPARQAALRAGIGINVPCTTVNKVCSSGMKSIMFAAQTIQLGLNDIAIAGGMESMSNIPYYVPKARWGYKYGDATLVDGLAKDGLTDAYDHQAMGTCADATAEKFKISREEQDRYAIRSYKLAAETTEKGWFKDEIVGVEIPQRKGDPITITEDEEYKRVKFDKIPSLRPAFGKDGTVTAANASTINDGAAALILASAEKVKELGLKPIAKIVAYADAAQEPQWFTTAPTLAAPKALERAGMSWDDVDYLEVNEAFAVVPMAFGQELKVDEDKMNVFGGAVSLGHPLGASGARIVTTLANVLAHRDANVGLATLCNGGGGASALIIERT